MFIPAHAKAGDERGAHHPIPGEVRAVVGAVVRIGADYFGIAPSRPKIIAGDGAAVPERPERQAADRIVFRMRN